MGDGAVGKTSLRRNYLGVGFTEEHILTIGADFAAKSVKYEFNGKKYDVTFQIWDLAGQETFNSVRSMYYKGCFGGILVFDRTRPSSFQNLKHWLEELSKHSSRGHVPLIILGNKADLVEDGTGVPAEEIEDFISNLNKSYSKGKFEVHYLDTSAKTGLNVKEAFDLLGEQVLHWLKAI